MSFYSALFAWVLIAVAFVAAIVLAMKGGLWLLPLAGVAMVFVLFFAVFGCASH